ncbi:GIY-YIG nuclease family protein [Paenibacillus sp. JCM 10914]|uniref:GIY-YIG nuclease family protein n=1 Tax=Paenibacillus sp. JCM 10914 TaxID=1236974 RepID=UPI0003CC7FC8|nr:GIY-YIG nuclease family protein [Paenibacillus sp. JCM 10914]GAE04977.1 LuxR family transcriptional regulator [Paenibacillus sp. JCM 10914]
MNRRSELNQQYKEIKIESGVYQIRNTVNGKVWVAGTNNFKTMNGKRFELQMNTSYNKELQQDWNEYGEDAFVFEILETIEVKPDPYFDLKDAVRKREAHWLETLNPFGDRGYNTPKPN